MDDKNNDDSEIKKNSDGTGWVVRSASITLAGTILGGFLIFINEVLIARILGAHEYGSYAIAIVVTRIAEALSLFGIGMAILHYLPIYISDKRQDLVLGTVISAAILPLFLALLLMILVLTTAEWLGAIVFGKPDIVLYLKVLVYAVPFLCISEVAAITTRAYGYAKYYVLIRNLIPPVIFTAFLMPIYFYQVDNINVGYGFVISYIAAFFIGIFWLYRVLGISEGIIRPSYRFRELYSYSFPVLVSTLMYMSILWTDILMLGAYVSSDLVGVYRGGMQIVVLFEIISVSFNAATAGQYSLLYSKNMMQMLKATYATANRWIAFIITPILLIIILKPRELLGLMGTEFTAGWLALVILVVGQSIRGYLGSSGFLLVLCKRQKIETLNAIVVALSNIALNALLIPKYGIVGAAIATSVAHLMLNLMRMAEVRFILGVRTLGIVHLIHLFTIAATYYLFSFLYASFVGAIENNLMDILLSLLVITIIYLAIILVTGIMRAEFRSVYQTLLGAEKHTP